MERKIRRSRFSSCARKGNKDMNVIWRFYRGEDREWRWQQISIARGVVADSASGYPDYENCLADAREQGYVYQGSPPGTRTRQ
jgi:hypothetical protein